MRDVLGAPGTVQFVVDGGSSGLTLVIPAWNEAAAIPVMLQASISALEQLQATQMIERWEIVVVDDGSTDGTSSMVNALAGDDTRIRLVRREVNRGLGAALREGFAASVTELTIYVDADLPFDLNEIGTALHVQRSTGAGLVAAYRRSRSGEGLRRWVYSAAYNALVRVVFRLGVRDVNFAGKLVTRDVLDSVVLQSDGSFFDAELVARVRVGGWGVEQFPVDYSPRTLGESTLSSFPVIRIILAEMASVGRPLVAERWRVAAKVNATRRSRIR